MKKHSHEYYTAHKQSEPKHSIRLCCITTSLKKQTFGKNIMSIFKPVATVNKSKWSYGVWWRGFEREYDRSCPRRPNISTSLDALNDFDPSSWMHGHDLITPLSVSVIHSDIFGVFNPFSYSVQLSTTVWSFFFHSCFMQGLKLYPALLWQVSLTRPAAIMQRLQCRATQFALCELAAVSVALPQGCIWCKHVGSLALICCNQA